ncbi:MAG: SDR family oxidoreductase [Clostridiales bacterium]|nr:SDR family oxidoreductase [Clostridiales bacterium]
MFDLTGKTALVTGSTQGIGFAVAACLAGQGASVFVHGGTSAGKAEDAAKKIPGAKAVCVDLSEKDAAAKLLEATENVDILVCNASVQFRKKWDEITQEEIEAQLQVNFAATLGLIQQFAPHMKENRWGRIITVGSVQQYKPHKDMAVYAASKAAQMSLVTNLAKQLAPFGITVNNLSPGVILTPRNEDALNDAEYKKQVLSGIPCGYAGTAEDCAAPVLLLASSEGRYITGCDLVADGGMRL